MMMEKISLAIYSRRSKPMPFCATTRRQGRSLNPIDEWSMQYGQSFMVIWFAINRKLICENLVRLWKLFLEFSSEIDDNHSQFWLAIKVNIEQSMKNDYKLRRIRKRRENKWALKTFKTSNWSNEETNEKQCFFNCIHFSYFSWTFYSFLFFVKNYLKPLQKGF